jgi:hypothetical protein
MWKNLVASTAIAVAVVVSASPASAQSDRAFAGWIGLITTPVGALPPVVSMNAAGAAPRGVNVQARYGHWQFDDDDDNTNNIGVGVSVPTGRSRTTFELGWSSKSDCSDCSAILGGVDVTIPVTPELGGQQASRGSTIAVAINPAVGFMKPTGEDADGTALSLAVSVPLSASFSIGEHARFIPFLSPGGGLGRISGSGDSETGVRAMIGGGVAFADIVPGVQVTGSFRKIFIDGGVTMYGIALTLGK